MRRAAMIVAAMLVTTTAPASQPAAKVSYTYPPQARAIPALRAWLDRQAATIRDTFERDAAIEQRDAAQDGRPFNRYQADRTWKVVADTPRFLSLSLARYEFTGGAHGNTDYSALVWDRATARRLQPESFFDPVQLRAAIKPAFCRELAAQRHRKREGYGDTSSIDEFDQCVDPLGNTLILGSSTRRRFDRIGILIAPYAAGPYVDGSYEVTLPVTPAMLAAVKPEWRSYFAAKAGTP